MADKLITDRIKKIGDFDAPELDIYARFTEAQLLNKDRPEETRIPTIGIPRRDREPKIFGALPSLARLYRMRDVLYRLLLYTERAAMITTIFRILAAAGMPMLEKI